MLDRSADTPRAGMDGKVVLVTGAGMGMGRATARLLAACGARVAMCDIDVAAGEAVAEEIVANGGEAVFCPADVADEAAVVATIEATVESFGRLDCAVNNAAIHPDNARLHELDLALFDRIVAINLRGVAVCLKHELRRLLAQGSGGAIVNLGSVASVRAIPMHGAYNAAKHGVIGLTKSAAMEYARDGIRVNAVLPGVIDTPMLQGQLARMNVSIDSLSGNVGLLGRPGAATEVAEAVLWLCSDSSSYVTGHALAVDGGYLAS